jgi:hypothetical protein
MINGSVRNGFVIAGAGRRPADVIGKAVHHMRIARVRSRKRI